MMNRSAVLLLLLFIPSLPACKGNDGDTSGLLGGKGGKATLRVSPRHHSRVIDSALVFIKYRTKDFPGRFDDSVRVRMIGGEQIALFDSLQKGSYYLYGKGWDPFLKDQVVGGLPFDITEERSFAVTLPVTEGD